MIMVTIYDLFKILILTNVVSLPPTMLIPSPLASFFSSMLLSSFLAGDFPGDFAGVLLGDLASGLVGVTDLARFWGAPALGQSEAVVAAESGDKVAFLASIPAVVAVVAEVGASLASFRLSSSSLGLTTRTLTLPVTCFRTKAA